MWDTVTHKGFRDPHEIQQFIKSTLCGQFQQISLSGQKEFEAALSSSD